MEISSIRTVIGLLIIVASIMTYLLVDYQNRADVFEAELSGIQREIRLYASTGISIR